MDESKEELELKLLSAQIAQLERSNPWMSYVGATITAIITSIAASIAVGVFILTLGEGYLGLKLEQIEKLDSEKSELIKQNLEQITRNSELLNEHDLIKRRIATVSGLSTMYDQGLDLRVTIEPTSKEIVNFVKVVSSTEKVKIEAYEPCPGKFVFPGEAPIFGSKHCNTLPNESSNCTIKQGETICLFGPLLVSGFREIGIWIEARVADKRAIRYVNLTP